MSNCIVCNNPVALNAQFFKVNTSGKRYYLHEQCARQNGLTNSNTPFSQVKRRIHHLISRIKPNPKKKRKPGGKASKKPEKPEKVPAEPKKKVMAQTGTERPEWAGFRIKGMVAGSSKFKIIPADTGKGKKLYVVHEFMFRKLLGIFGGKESAKAEELVKQAARQAAVEHGKPQESRQPWKRFRHYQNVVKVIEHLAERAQVRAKKRAKQHKDAKNWEKYYRFSPPTVVKESGKYSIYLPEKKNPSGDDVVEFFGVVGGKVIEVFRETGHQVKLLFRQVVPSIKANPTKSFDDSDAAIEWAEANATDYEDPEYNTDTGKWELHFNDKMPTKLEKRRNPTWNRKELIQHYTKVLKYPNRYGMKKSSKSYIRSVLKKLRRNPVGLTNVPDLLKWWSQGLSLGLIRFDGKVLEKPDAKRFINWWTNGLTLGILNVNPPQLNKIENIFDHIIRIPSLGLLSTGKAGVLNPKKRWPQRYGFDEQTFASSKAEIKRLRRMFKKNPEFSNLWYRHAKDLWSWSQAGYEATVKKIGKKWEYSVNNNVETIGGGTAKSKDAAMDRVVDLIRADGFEENPKVFGKIRCHNCGMPYIIRKIPVTFECHKCGKKITVNRRRQLKKQLSSIRRAKQGDRGLEGWAKIILGKNYGKKLNPHSEATPGFLQKYRQMKWPEIPGKIKQQIVRLVEGKQRQNPARKHIRCPICPHAKRFDNSADLLEHLDVKHSRRKNILPLLIPLAASAAPMVATAAAQAGAEVGKQVAQATAPKKNPRGRRFPNGVWSGPCHKCGYKGFWKKHGRHDMCPKCKKVEHHGPSR